jgi:hypothetical protein
VFEHQQFTLQGSTGQHPQAAYSSFPLQSAGEFFECVQQKWKDSGGEIVQPREWATI